MTTKELYTDKQKIFNTTGYYIDGRYFHYVKNHLGSICLVLDSEADSIVQSTYYSASGIPFSTNLDEQPYLYNGKEFVTAHGLNEYDSKARMYYATIMRTTTMDPMYESYYHISPYAWCGNNPIKYIDPDGRDIRWESKREGKIYQQYKKNVNKRERKAAKEVASINKKLQKNPRNRAALLSKLANAEQKLGTYQQIQCELATMEGSGTIFIIDGEGGGNLYDQTDEIEAYKHQSLFETSLEGMSDNVRPQILIYNPDDERKPR